MHAALNNWDCKVNVRRIAKDGSPPPTLPASRPASVSWLHTSKSHTSTVLESVLVMLFWNIKTICDWRQLFEKNEKLYDV